jgi:hypothetical protein
MAKRYIGAYSIGLDLSIESSFADHQAASKEFGGEHPDKPPALLNTSAWRQQTRGVK